MKRAVLTLGVILALFPRVASAQFGSYESIRPIPGGLGVNVEGSGSIPAPMGRILVVMRAADGGSTIASADEALVQRTLVTLGGTAPEVEARASESPANAVVFADFANPTYGLVYSVVQRIRSLTLSGNTVLVREAMTFWTPGCRAIHERARSEALERADALAGDYAKQHGLTLGDGRDVSVTLDPPVLKGDICLSGVSIPARFDPPADPSKRYTAGTDVRLYVRYDVK